MDLKTQIIGLNTLLSEIYGDGDMRLSRFLARFKNKTILARWETGIRELVAGLLKHSDESGEAHPYIIETDEDPDGNKRMIINKGDGAVQNPDIVLTDNTFASFYHDFMSAVKRLGWNRLIHSYSLSEVKKQFPRAYERWTDEEDQTLKASFSKGVDVTEQSALLGRQPGAIRSRLLKLGLMPA